MDIILQYLGLAAVGLIAIYLVTRALIVVDRHRQARTWRRDYETSYERDQRRSVSRVQWQHRLRIEVPTFYRRRDLDANEEAAMRRARAYYE